MSSVRTHKETSQGRFVATIYQRKVKVWTQILMLWWFVILSKRGIFFSEFSISSFFRYSVLLDKKYQYSASPSLPFVCAFGKTPLSPTSLLSLSASCRLHCNSSPRLVSIFPHLVAQEVLLVPWGACWLAVRGPLSCQVNWGCRSPYCVFLHGGCWDAGAGPLIYCLWLGYSPRSSFSGWDIIYLGHIWQCWHLGPLWNAPSRDKINERYQRRVNHDAFFMKDGRKGRHTKAIVSPHSTAPCSEQTRHNKAWHE